MHDDYLRPCGLHESYYYCRHKCNYRKNCGFVKVKTQYDILNKKTRKKIKIQ